VEAAPETAATTAHRDVGPAAATRAPAPCNSSSSLQQHLTSDRSQAELLREYMGITVKPGDAAGAGFYSLGPSRSVTLKASAASFAPGASAASGGRRSETSPPLAASAAAGSSSGGAAAGGHAAGTSPFPAAFGHSSSDAALAQALADAEHFPTLGLPALGGAVGSSPGLGPAAGSDVPGAALGGSAAAAFGAAPVAYSRAGGLGTGAGAQGARGGPGGGAAAVNFRAAAAGIPGGNFPALGPSLGAQQRSAAGPVPSSAAAAAAAARKPTTAAPGLSTISKAPGAGAGLQGKGKAVGLAGSGRAGVADEEVEVPAGPAPAHMLDLGALLRPTMGPLGGGRAGGGGRKR
jgi:hypothetical protein